MYADQTFTWLANGTSEKLDASPRPHRGKTRRNIILKTMQTGATTFHTVKVKDSEIFYRRSGDPKAPAILLLHGFPTSSHMFRDLMPLLADSFHLVAPDLPGFGNTVSPSRGLFEYTFDNLAKTMDDFADAIGLNCFALYVFDYGAPVGFRLALMHPDRITAIISQNGNAYLEGFSEAWGVWKNYWRNPTPANREACRDSLSATTIREIQYLHGTDPSRISPDGFTLDMAYLARPGADEIQLDLILDYRTNPLLYPAFQKYFREHQPPTLAVWGRNDLHFLPAGAEAYRRDNPNAKVVLLNTGHFALESHAVEIAGEIQKFFSTAARGQDYRSLLSGI